MSAFQDEQTITCQQAKSLQQAAERPAVDVGAKRLPSRVYINQELVDWMTQPCDPRLAPRADNG